MSVLKNPKHELFAQELSKGKTADDAYRLAGYAAHRSNAARMITNDNILRRLAELQNRGAERAEVTIEALIERGLGILDKAEQEGQYSAAVSALREVGVLSGLRVEKSERKNTNDVRSLTDEELDAAIADALAREEAAEGSEPGQIH